MIRGIMFEEPQPYVYQPWPSWRYGPDGEAAIFEREDDVPEGWTTTPHQEKTDEKVLPDLEEVSTPDEAEGQGEGLLAELSLLPEAGELEKPRRGRPPKRYDF